MKAIQEFLILLVFLNFFSLISPVTVQDPINIEHKYNFFISDTPTNKNYLEYILLGNDPSINYVLSAYLEESRQKRLQLGQSIKGVTKLYLNIKNDDFKGKIFFDLECSKYPCSGTAHYDFLDAIKLVDGEPINYFLNQNEAISFSMNLMSDKVNIWARGQYDIDSSLSGISTYEYEKKKIGNSIDVYITKKIYDNVILTVNAKKGDYINVGLVSYYKINEDYNTISPLQLEGGFSTGYLKKDILDKICYELEDSASQKDTIAGTGILFTKFAYAYFAKTNGTLIGGKELFTSGYIKNAFSTQYFGEDLKVCITFPDPIEELYSNLTEIVFTYQIENLEEKEYIEKEPQLNGILYSRLITKNSKVAFISQKDDSFNKMSLNLNSIFGFPKMYVYECDTYPLCSFDDTTLQNAIRPRNINRFSSYNVYKKEGLDNSPISKKQTLFVVQCMKAQNISDNILPNYMDIVCDFNSLIYKENTIIELREEKYFNQYALLNEEHYYKIKLCGQKNVEKIFIDIMTYVGDVEVNTQSIKNLGIKADQYDSINKIFISVKNNGNQFEELNFSVKGLNNTYYTILVTFSKNKDNEDSFITNVLQSGMNYLVTVDTAKASESDDANKIIKFRNDRIADLIPYMVNFYSINCEINVGGINEIGEEIPLQQYEHYSYDLVTFKSQKYTIIPYEYRIRIKAKDPSEYSQNLCKIFTSAVELSKSHDDYTRDILIPDNTPQQIMFSEEYSHISLGYIHVDFKNDLLIKFKLINTAKYKVRLYYENHARDEEVIIVSDNLLYLSSSEWSTICKDNSRVCYIQLDIALEQTKEYEKPLLELSIKSIGSYFVSYLQKNYLKKDYAQNNIPQYYYTEIGTNEEGSIIVNFLRGSGRVFARIVNKNIVEAEINFNWKGKYKLPSENDLAMDPFTKILSFKTNNECSEGCYLLINVVSDVKSDRISLEKGRNYPFSIIVNSYPRNINYLNIPAVRIPIDEYIIGSVYPSDSESKLQYYSVCLNADADFVVIDWQGDWANISINIGEKKPIKNKGDFTFFGNGKHTLYKISKNEIFNNIALIGKNKDLKDIVLTIGIWTDVVTTISTTPFSFAIRLEDDVENEIYRVNSDQKVLCKAKTIGNEKYRCVYVMDYDFIHEYISLFIYPNLQDKSASFEAYASFINATEYEMTPKNNIKNFIPNKTNYKYSTEKEKKDYLFINEGTKIDKYVLISVETSKETIIEFISTIFLYQDEITPNPSSLQLMSTYEGFDIKLNFPRNYMELVSIVCVGGSGIIFWENNKDKPYYLKGRDDRISITSPNSNKDELQLTIKGSDNIDPTDPFVVIVEYNIRHDLVNFDILNLHKSVNYIYTNSDFPVVLYCPLNALNMSKNDYYDILFTYYNLETTEDKPLTYYESYSFTALGFIVNETFIFKSKSNPSEIPEVNKNTIFGFYDPGMRTGLIRINSSVVAATEKQYLFLKLDKSDQFKDVRKYKSISLETTVFHKSSKTPISELTNQFGYLNINQTEVHYTLRNDKSKKYMNLELSFENDNINIIINNSLLEPKEVKYGKKFYALQTSELDNTVNLNLKRNGEKGKDNLQYFFFRYTFSDNEINSKYSINKTSIKVTQKYGDKTSNYSIILTPINNYNKYDVTYIVRLITDKNMPKNSDLSMKIGIQNIKEFYNPKPDGESLNLIITDAIYKANYVQVIAQIKEKEDVEYLSYDLQNDFINENGNDKKDKGIDKVVLASIIIGSVLVVLVIILLIVIIIFNKNNKNLMNKVNQVSFSDNDKKDGDENLLLDNE